MSKINAIILDACENQNPATFIEAIGMMDKDIVKEFLRKLFPMPYTNTVDTLVWDTTQLGLGHVSQGHVFQHWMGHVPGTTKGLRWDYDGIHVSTTSLTFDEKTTVFPAHQLMAIMWLAIVTS